jgi:antitoxin (DNA-binding transcriptional repressor) of toxin-antitoxin stability system
MKFIEQAQATDSLADYASKIDSGPVVVTNHGQPVAALVPIENGDIETVSLSTNRGHAEDPERWPLPTGTVYERWFKDAES